MCLWGNSTDSVALTVAPGQRASDHAVVTEYSRGGFSLVEVLVAMSILGITIAAVILALQLGMQQMDAARTTTLVGQVLQDEAEQVRAFNWAKLSQLPAQASLPTPDAFKNNPTLANKGLTITRTIQDEATELKRITITASWKDLGGVQHSRQMFVLYGKGGVYDYYFSSN